MPLLLVAILTASTCCLAIGTHLSAQASSLRIEPATKISFKTEEGQDYALMASPDAKLPEWHVITEILDGRSKDFTLLIPVMTETQQFFLLKKEAHQMQSSREAISLGKMVQDMRAALQAPADPESLETIADYGTITEHYMMIRGWLNQERTATESLLSVAQTESRRKELQKEVLFLKTAIRRIDLER
ncbi:MAG: hypothetical protein P8L18_02690 [Verrucomicrobiota bacterium]|nr:hypothetical protein [Verrucomicrobiota bacterium]